VCNETLRIAGAGFRTAAVPDAIPDALPRTIERFAGDKGKIYVGSQPAEP